MCMITIMHALPMSSNTDAHHSMPPIHAVATELSVAPCFRPLYFGVHWHPANHHHRGSANHRVHWADLPLGTTGEEFRRWCDGIVPRVQQVLQAVMMASPGQASSLQGSHGGTVAMQLVHMEKTNPPYSGGWLFTWRSLANLCKRPMTTDPMTTEPTCRSPPRALVGRLGQEGGPGRAVRSLRGGSEGCVSDGGGRMPAPVQDAGPRSDTA
jgi:hypothetical protein